MRRLFRVLSLYCATAGLLFAAIEVSAATPEKPTTQRVTRTNPGERLLVHEWGTFTALQDAAGRSLPYINTDDEPVPQFVHRLDHRILENDRKVLRRNLGNRRFKSIAFDPGLHVTMRLETPVVYFYPPASAQTPLTLDVSVRSPGGWLSEFYPKALGTAPGIDKLRLSSNAVGTLDWKNLRVGTDGTPPATKENVWLAPREVRAATVTAESGESEKYLFYRGVGRYDSPLSVTTDRTQGTLSVFSKMSHLLRADETDSIPTLWLVHIQPDASLAFRQIDPLTITSDATAALATIRSGFEPSQFSTGNFESLRGEMHAALVEDGLFADEAHAMLNVWEHAYFKTAGLRLFYVVPRRWTDARLPIEFSVPTELVRTMVGRIELITPLQHELVERIAGAPSKTIVQKDGKKYVVYDFTRADKAYQDLGRFRYAIVQGAVAREPNATLSAFLSQNSPMINLPSGVQLIGK